jgi:protein phosphatase 2C family protein 2/3
VFPGRLSVSRTFGDIEAKREKFGGNPNVVIAVPDIKEFTIDDKMDFLLLGCKYIISSIFS